MALERRGGERRPTRGDEGDDPAGLTRAEEVDRVEREARVRLHGGCVVKQKQRSERDGVRRQRKQAASAGAPDVRFSRTLRPPRTGVTGRPPSGPGRASCGLVHYCKWGHEPASRLVWHGQARGRKGGSERAKVAGARPLRAGRRQRAPGSSLARVQACPRRSLPKEVRPAIPSRLSARVGSPVAALSLSAEMSVAVEEIASRGLVYEQDPRRSCGEREPGPGCPGGRAFPSPSPRVVDASSSS